ncbi:MAG: hypothetical protein EP335_14150 [Alphaproteobacteria bacterium]|nr:MAG: hypothetical protein EP335_14150 [Alphaproteobacteria bacterium]
MTSKEYNTFIGNVEFEGLRLVGSETSSDNAIFEALSERKEIKKSLEYKVANIFHSEDENLLIVDMSWTVKVRLQKKIVFKAFALYQIVYSGFSGGVKEEFIDKFCASTVKATSYPYFRQLFNQACSDTCVTLPPLPMLKFLPSVGTK